MSKENTHVSGGIGFFGLLTILFIGLKITNLIDWSWWWVLSPILGISALFFLVLLLFFFVGLFEIGRK